ncbi:MAG: enoyl-CoA hydratase/isomerase family protein [Syntrophobacteraceae bacterium]
MKSLESIELKVDNGLAYFTLNQPEIGNTFNELFCHELALAAEALSLNKDVRAILISAKGKFFCLGGDIKMMSGDRSSLQENMLRWTRNMHVGMARLWQIGVPIVTAVHAAAMGGSMGLIGGSDVVYCAKSAVLGAAYCKLGLAIDAGTSVALATRMGISRARRFLLLSEVLSAAEAEKAGLVDFVVEDDQVLAEAEKTARSLAEGPTLAFGEVRRVMLSAFRQGIETQLEHEAQGMTRAAGTEDAWEGVSAFLERRKTAFKGR